VTWARAGESVIGKAGVDASPQTIDVSGGPRDEHDVDVTSARMVLVGLRGSEVPHAEKLGVLEVLLDVQLIERS
jgi:hypothetical protein